MEKHISVLLVVLLLASCSWVKLDKEAESVLVKQKSEVADCRKIAHTTVSLRSRILGIERNKEKVQKELETLARNAAVDYEGNAVVASSVIKDGKQSFDVYRCP
jgi:phenylalanyl-tRNA synthetase beta subunit